jgi:hypothetical protein
MDAAKANANVKRDEDGEQEVTTRMEQEETKQSIELPTMKKPRMKKKRLNHNKS